MAQTIENEINISSQRVVRVLDRIVANHGHPLKMQIDNGPELISQALTQWAEDHGVILVFITLTALSEMSCIVSDMRCMSTSPFRARFAVWRADSAVCYAP
jgi:hypothetical protein